jgi:hypothetical protein
MKLYERKGVLSGSFRSDACICLLLHPYRGIKKDAHSSHCERLTKVVVTIVYHRILSLTKLPREGKLMEATDFIEVEYDRFGRMKRNSIYHQNQGKPFTVNELEYICKYWHADHMDDIGLALGRTGISLAQKVSMLKKEGKFYYYKNLNRHW